jgi:hypothetical protein
MDLIKDIKDDNTTLHRLSEHTRTLQVSSQYRRIPDFAKIRSSAASIFGSLRKGLQVSCVASHKASIYLGLSADWPDPPSVSPGEDDSLLFRIVLHHDVVDCKQKAPPWSVQEAEIRIIEAVPADALQASILPSVSLCTPKQRPTVGFTLPTRPDPQLIPAKGLTEIQDLCGSLHGMLSAECGTCLGYIRAHSSADRHGLYQPKKKLIDTTPLSAESLTNLLGRSTLPICKWTNADARRLAVPLAAGVLRLHDTPWLGATWSDKDITVMFQNGKVLAEHPFVSGQLNNTAVVTPDPSFIAAVIRNKTLFTLGIVLTELCMGKPMDELSIPGELNADGTKHDLSDYLTVSRLLNLEEISNKFGRRWSDVVRRCIYCDFNHSKTSLDDAGFLKAVYHGVLVELEVEHRQFFGLGD